CMQAREYPLTF
nr:immunoglobulin light chain junction region [Macaca mulatta]